MMAGNPRGWSIHPSSSLQFVFGSSVSSSSLLPFDPLPQENQEHHHQSWSQLLMGGLSEEEDRYKLGKWEEQHMMNMNNPPFSGSCSSTVVGDKKQEVSGHNLYRFEDHEEQFHTTQKWSLQQQHQVIPVSSPRSCVTTLSSNMLDFSYTNPEGPSHHMDQSSECNSSASGRACKKARVQATTSQPPLKVRKEKLGDRITALHQLVSPFGKTDTASVLLEAIGYIRFLQGQIEALSSPYLTSANSNNIRSQHSAERERNNVFPEDPGQLLNDICLKRNGGPNLQDSQDNRAKDLKSRGLCLVPLSCTLHVGNDNGADYWAPAMGGGFYN